MDPRDIGSSFDEPADPSQLSGGQDSLDPSTGKRITLFALLKLIALQLQVLIDGPDGAK